MPSSQTMLNTDGNDTEQKEQPQSWLQEAQRVPIKEDRGVEETEERVNSNIFSNRSP